MQFIAQNEHLTAVLTAVHAECDEVARWAVEADHEAVSGHNMASPCTEGCAVALEFIQGRLRLFIVSCVVCKVYEVRRRRI